MSLDFNTLSQPVKRALTEMGFTTPTPIQREAIPPALEGYDIMGQAATGTGKTAAFGIPTVERVKRGEGVQALILTPTRELALQVRDQLKAIGRYKGIKAFAFYGGTPVQKNLEVIDRFRPEIIIGTPGRIKDLIDRGALDLRGVKVLTLDEADVMLDMGFIEDIEYIISFTPKSRQTFLFSATIPKNVIGLAKKHLRRNYRFIKVSSDELKPKIEEVIIDIESSRHRFRELERVLRQHPEDKTIVFVKTKRDAKDITAELKKRGFKVVSLHGDMTQRQREISLKLFKDNKVRVIVATDVASRGLDIRDVSLVVNYHIPEEPERYIHRIGRTGRIGRSGKALSFIAPEDKKFFARISRLKRNYQVA